MIRNIVGNLGNHYSIIKHRSIYASCTRRIIRRADQGCEKKIVAGITDVFVKEGIAPEAVTVILVEIKKENYGHNGKLLS